MYVPIAERGSVVYFVICNLPNIDPIYEFSLDYFTTFFIYQIKSFNEFKDNIKLRVSKLRDLLTEQIFRDVC